MSEVIEVTVQLSALTRAVGHDGKRRPASLVGVQLQRSRIGELITASPDASDRSIARQIGCSPSTVASVRGSLSNRNNEVGHQSTKSKTRLDSECQHSREIFQRICQSDLYDEKSKCGSRLRWGYMVMFLASVMEADEPTQRLILGATSEEIEAGTTEFSDVFFAHAPEIGEVWMRLPSSEKGSMLESICTSLKKGGTLQNVAGVLQRL